MTFYMSQKENTKRVMFVTGLKVYQLLQSARVASELNVIHSFGNYMENREAWSISELHF